MNILKIGYLISHILYGNNIREIFHFLGLCSAKKESMNYLLSHPAGGKSHPTNQINSLSSVDSKLSIIIPLL